MAASLVAQNVWQSPVGTDFLHLISPNGGAVLSYIDGSGAMNFAPIFNDAVTGQSPSYKVLYSNVELQSGVTGALQYFKAVQGQITTDSGANPAETWGGYFINNVNGTGVQNAAWGCVGETNVYGTGTISSAFAGYFHSYIASTKTVSSYPTGLDAAVLADLNMATGRRKADAALAVQLNGALNQSTAGAGAGIKVLINNNQCTFDYGLDMDLLSMASTTFALADIRFSNGAVLFASTQPITANSTTTTLPAGSLGFTTNATGKGAIFYSDGSKWQSIA